MIKEPGVFSQRYLMRKGKENHNSINNNHPNPNHHTHQPHQPQHPHAQNQSNPHHLVSQHDFPLAYTSAKTISRERNSISVSKKKVEDKKNDKNDLKQMEQKNEIISKLQKQLKEVKDHGKRVTREVQNRYNQYDRHISELSEDLKEKQELLIRKQVVLKEEKSRSTRYKQAIKRQIYWLLSLFKRLHEGPEGQEIKRQVSNAFMTFKDYITEFNIEKELQELASATAHQITSKISQNQAFPHLNKKNMDSIFTQDLQQGNVVKIMELQPLIETFNNQQCYIAPEEEKQNKMERITKRLFDDSEMFRQSNQCSLMVGEQERKNNASNSQISENQFLVKEVQQQLPREVRILRSFEADSRHQNFITLKEGEQLKLLRKIRDKLWIGELGDKIGLVSEEYFKPC